MHSVSALHGGALVSWIPWDSVATPTVPKPMNARPAVARTAPAIRVTKMPRKCGNFANIAPIVGSALGRRLKANALGGGLKMLQTNPGNMSARPARFLLRPARAVSRPVLWLWAHRLHTRAPLWLLGGLSLASLGARLLYLGNPVDSANGKSSLIFDEAFYVNAP